MDFGRVFKRLICGTLVKTECEDWWVQDKEDPERWVKKTRGHHIWVPEEMLAVRRDEYGWYITTVSLILCQIRKMFFRALGSAVACCLRRKK